MTQTDRQNMVAVQEIVTKLDAGLRGELAKVESLTREVEDQAVGAVATVTAAVDGLDSRLEENAKAIANLSAHSSEARSNLDNIRTEIQQSVSFLTGEMEKNITMKVTELEAANSRVERSLASQYGQLSAEVNKLRSHTQRSVDASSGVQQDVARLEGESWGCLVWGTAWGHGMLSDSMLM